MAGELIIGAALLGGGLLLLLKAQADKQKQKSTCEQACGSDAECLVACNVAGGLLGALSPGRSNAQVLSDEAKKNDALNGPIKTRIRKLSDPYDGTAKSGHVPELPYGIGGDALEYENGCVPVFGAPGWSKCVQGTVGMWGEENRNLDESSNPARNIAARAARLRPTDPLPPIVDVYDSAVLRSGSFDQQKPDPATQGPESNDDGTNTWLVAGVELRCPGGECPKLADATHFAWPPTCAPVPTVVQPGVGNPLGGGDVRTSFPGCPTPAGFTWILTNGTWALERLRAGQTTVNQGPCATSSGASSGSGVVVRAAFSTDAGSHFA